MKKQLPQLTKQQFNNTKETSQGKQGVIRLALLLTLFSFCLSMTSAWAEPIKIGAIFPRTGKASQRGEAYFSAVNYAVNELNRNGGILGRQLEVLEFDNASTPKGAMQAALKAADQGVTAVVGCTWSSHSKAAAKVLQERKIPMISPISTSPDVTLIGDYIFRVCFTDDFQGSVVARFAREELKAVRAAVLTDKTSMFSKGLSRTFKEAFKQLGGEVVMSKTYVIDQATLDSITGELKQLKPDVCFIPDHEADSVRLMKYFTSKGVNTRFLGGDGWTATMYPVKGSEIRGSYYSTHWHPEVESPVSRAFVKEVRKKASPDEKELTLWALSNDAVNLLADAIVRADSADPAAIRAALADTTEFEGITGRISFNGHGDPIKPAVILKFNEDGKTIDYVRQVMP